MKNRNLAAPEWMWTHFAIDRARHHSLEQELPKLKDNPSATGKVKERLKKIEKRLREFLKGEHRKAADRATDLREKLERLKDKPHLSEDAKEYEERLLKAEDEVETYENWRQEPGFGFEPAERRTLMERFSLERMKQRLEKGKPKGREHLPNTRKYTSKHFRQARTEMKAQGISQNKAILYVADKNGFSHDGFRTNFFRWKHDRKMSRKENSNSTDQPVSS